MTLSNLTHHSVRLVRPARSPLFARALLAAAGVRCLLAAGAAGARADTTAQPLPLTQAWSDSGLITTDDDWSAVPGIVGYRGDSEAADGVDPATVTDDLSEIVDVNANRSSPDNLFSGGVTEFELADPAVALQGSATADAPHLVARVSTAGRRAITVSYRLRDLDGSADDAVQAVALQYRVGDSGPYANVPAGYVADATTGPGVATQETAIAVTLPSDADDLPLVDVRILTANAAGSDEHVGVDDISIDGDPLPPDTTALGSRTPASSTPTRTVRATPATQMTTATPWPTRATTARCSPTRAKPIRTWPEAATRATPTTTTTASRTRRRPPEAPLASTATRTTTA
jgi:hypothetical protein